MIELQSSRDRWKKEMLEVKNLENKSGSLGDALVGDDIFLGVSAPKSLTQEMVIKVTNILFFPCKKG